MEQIKKQGVVITTSAYTKDFLKDCLISLKSTPYYILIVSNDNYVPDLSYLDRQYQLFVNPINGWELAGISKAKEVFDSFVHIMDTTLIKDISLFEKVLALDGNVVFTKGNFHYMGKFVTKELPNLPIVHDKTLAIYLEVRWLDGFKYTEFEPDLPVHTNVFEEIHGMRRMKLENKYMIKWKGTHWVTQQQRDEIEKELIARKDGDYTGVVV